MSEITDAGDNSNERVPRTYEPGAIEDKWYAHWLAERCFEANPASHKPPYSIVIPPPNVTGVLTLGHVLNNTIQDILARRARMLGKEVLWLPGTDHAGIATQTVVERTLKKSGEIRHRDDLGRERFVERVWEWKEKHGGIIIQQLKKLGASCDWSRTRFTMDPAYTRCVEEVFVALYEKGCIYRGKRMVNWCPASLTALSDEEVIMKPQQGTMFHFKVEVAEEPGTWLTIATTRPETIPGDTAVAVNPKDARYAHLVGKHVVRPLPPELAPEQKLIPIIADAQVEFAFGTGVLKVTPAHDKADFEIGQRHGLAPIDIMNPDATMNALAGASLVGLDRLAARTAAVELLREMGALEKEEPYQNNVGFSERADVPIEPRLSEQWFLKYPRTNEARNVVASGKLRFHPERWAKVYDHWMANIQDWCISRQLWWGHRIPVWYKKAESNVARTSGLPEKGNQPDNQRDACAASADEKIHVGLESPGDGWERDPDVLDTWFSSWLWPFVTMGWPEKTPALATFYPTTDLVTGPDIIFFWVARMIMAGLEFTGTHPFQNVYFTGIIRDKQGRKMSKSLGNSPDPLDLIAKFGADALRFGVMRSAPLGQDVLFDEKNVELGRNFCTKLWNAARFRQLHGGTGLAEIDANLLTSDDRRILMALDDAIDGITAALEAYEFAGATARLHGFFWGDFCDWYLEASKASLNSPDAERKTHTLGVIDFILDRTLRLLHPFLPFITEELWHGLGYNARCPDEAGVRTIVFTAWPTRIDATLRDAWQLDERARKFADDKYAVVTAGRTLRRDLNVASNKRLHFILRANAPLERHESEPVKVLLNAERLDFVDPAWQAPKGTPHALTPLGELFLPLAGVVDIAAERERLNREIARVEQELAKVRAKLANDTFVKGAPPAVVEEHRRREAGWQQQLEQLARTRESLGD
jgi:valyl-tRNA synthetase